MMEKYVEKNSWKLRMSGWKVGWERKLMSPEWFLLRPTKTQSPQIWEIIEMKIRSKLLGAFGQNCPNSYSNVHLHILPLACLFYFIFFYQCFILISFFFSFFFFLVLICFFSHQFWLVFFYFLFSIFFLENGFGLISCTFF